MNLPELLALVGRAPVLLAELAAAGTSVSVAVGGLGTVLEHFGAALGNVTLEKLGQRLEAFGVDLPKLWRGSRATNTREAAISAVLK